MQTTDFLKMSLRVECILHVLKAHAWGSSGCAAQHVVDPFNVSPLTVHCQRKGDSFSVTRALQHVRRELLTLFEVLSTAVVLGGRFSAKGCALLPVPLISREIEHVDPPSVIPPAEAQKIVDVQHAGFIERNLGAAADTSAEYGAEEIKMIGHVNRNTKELRELFFTGEPLKQCREELARRNLPVRLDSGCLVFVKPWQHEEVVKAIAQRDDITASHIIFSSSFQSERAERRKPPATEADHAWRSFLDPPTLPDLPGTGLSGRRRFPNPILTVWGTTLAFDAMRFVAPGVRMAVATAAATVAESSPFVLATGAAGAVAVAGGLALMKASEHRPDMAQRLRRQVSERPRRQLAPPVPERGAKGAAAGWEAPGGGADLGRLAMAAFATVAGHAARVHGFSLALRSPGEAPPEPHGAVVGGRAVLQQPGRSAGLGTPLLGRFGLPLPPVVGFQSAYSELGFKPLDLRHVVSDFARYLCSDHIKAALPEKEWSQAACLIAMLDHLLSWEVTTLDRGSSDLIQASWWKYPDFCQKLQESVQRYGMGSGMSSEEEADQVLRQVAEEEDLLRQVPAGFEAEATLLAANLPKVSALEVGSHFAWYAPVVRVTRLGSCIFGRDANQLRGSRVRDLGLAEAWAGLYFWRPGAADSPAQAAVGGSYELLVRLVRAAGAGESPSSQSPEGAASSSPTTPVEVPLSKKVVDQLGETASVASTQKNSARSAYSGASSIGSEFINDQIPVHQREVAKIQSQMKSFVKGMVRGRAMNVLSASASGRLARQGGKRSKKKAQGYANEGAENSGRRGPRVTGEVAPPQVLPTVTIAPDPLPPLPSLVQVEENSSIRYCQDRCRSEAIWDHVQAVKDNWNPFEVYQYALSGQYTSTLNPLYKVMDKRLVENSSAPLMTFHLFREIVWHAKTRAGTNFADPKTRIVRYKVLTKATQPLWELGMNFGVMNEFDITQNLLNKYPKTSWFSLPGPCPLSKLGQKSKEPRSAEECVEQQPGGRCPDGMEPNGQGDCTFITSYAGEVKIDDLVGISNYQEFIDSGGREYDRMTDQGVHMNFWDGRWQLHLMKFGNGPVTTCIQFWQDLGKDINRTRVDLGLSGPGLDMGLPGPTPRRATVVRRPVPNGSARRPGRFDSVLDEWRTAKLLELFDKTYPTDPTIEAPECDFNKWMPGSMQRGRAPQVAPEESENVLKTPAIEAENVHKVYDAIASHWNHTRYKAWPRVEAFVRSLPRHSLVADLGCGNGKNLPHVKEAGGFAVASDISAPLAQIAAEDGACSSAGLALRLAEAGCGVMVVGRSPDRGQALVEELRRRAAEKAAEQGAECEEKAYSFRQLDAFSLPDCRQLANEIQKEGGLDYLVLTQGMATMQGYTPTPVEKGGLDEKLTLHYYSRVSFIHACPGFVATSWGTEMPWLVKRLVRALQRFGRSKEDAGEYLFRSLYHEEFSEGGCYIVNEFGEKTQKFTALQAEAKDAVWARTKEVFAFGVKLLVVLGLWACGREAATFLGTPAPARGSARAAEEESAANEGGRRLLVLGGNGFVGREVCRLAVQRGFKVTSLSRRGENPEPGNEQLDQVNWVQGNAVDAGTVSNLVGEADAVVHAIGLLFDANSGLTNLNLIVSGSKSTPDDTSTYDRITRQTAFNVINAIKGKLRLPFAPPTPMMFVSAAEAGWPDVTLGEQEYLVAKRAVEAELRSSDAIRAAMFRPSLIWSWTKFDVLPVIPVFNLLNALGVPFVDKTVTVSTLSKAIVAGLEDESEHGASCMVADCLAAPLRDGAFDAVLSIAVLHHLSTRGRRVQALREAARLLRVGGQLLVYCWSFEQDDDRSRSRHRFVAQEPATQPFRTPGLKKGKPSEQPEPAPDEERSDRWEEQPPVCQRYCHVYREGELEDLLEEVPQLEVVDSYFDTGNWCAIARRRP
eukprot:g9497.t1